MKINILILILILLFSACTIPPDQIEKEKNSQATPLTTSETQPITTLTNQTTITKIDLTVDLCPQITSEFVTQTTGISIARTNSINDDFINVCDYYLSEDKNSPYIAIIVNKNQNYEKHKQIAVKNKFILKTDPNIKDDHFIAWADNETRIVNINLFLTADSFIRIDKNVERAIDNEGMINLAQVLSKRI